LETKKGNKIDEKQILNFFTNQYLEILLSFFYIIEDNIILNELLLIFIHLTLINDEYIAYFLKDSLFCEKLFNFLNCLDIKEEKLLPIFENILIIIGNFLSIPDHISIVLNSLPFANFIGANFIINIQTFPNTLISVILWVFRKGLMNFLDIFSKYINQDIIDFVSKKSIFFFEPELLNEATLFLETISNFEDEEYNQYLINANILNYCKNYIKKNYDFELTSHSFSLLYNLCKMEVNKKILITFFFDEIFWFSLDHILIDINENFDNYETQDITLFLKSFLKILSKFLLVVNEIKTMEKLTENAIEINIIFIIMRIKKKNLLYIYLKFVRKKLKTRNDKVFPSLISIGFFQNFLENIFEKYNDDVKMMLYALEIMDIIFNQGKKFNNRMIHRIFMDSNAFEIVNKMRNNSNDKLSEYSNNIFEYIDE